MLGDGPIQITTRPIPSTPWRERDFCPPSVEKLAAPLDSLPLFIRCRMLERQRIWGGIPRGHHHPRERLFVFFFFLLLQLPLLIGSALGLLLRRLLFFVFASLADLAPIGQGSRVAGLRYPFLWRRTGCKGTTRWPLPIHPVQCVGESV